MGVFGSLPFRTADHGMHSNYVVYRAIFCFIIDISAVNPLVYLVSYPSLDTSAQRQPARDE